MIQCWIRQLFKWMGFIHLEEHGALLHAQAVKDERAAAINRLELHGLRQRHNMQRRWIAELLEAKCKQSETPPSTRS